MLKITQKVKPIVLCILDGWGIAKAGPGNAITLANPSNFNSLWFSFPHTYLKTVGQSVGLPQGEVGNSEVGHQNLGAGKVVFQDLLRINMALADGSFFQNEALLSAIEHAKKNNGKVHLLGLVGLGSIHSDNSHLFAILTLLKNENVPSANINIHLFTDGRDSPPTSAKISLSEIENKLKTEDLGKIATISGRYYAMDRDNRWERTEKAYLTLTGKSQNKSLSALKLIEDSYLAGITDEFIEPTAIENQSDSTVTKIKEGDSVIFFNFRPDRARQLTRAFTEEDFSSAKTSSNQVVKTFARGPKIKNLFFSTLTRYEVDLPVSAVAFEKNQVIMPIGRVFSERGLRQFHIAETEKYAHVTYFFNGGREAPFKGEDRLLVDSPKVASYDQKPEMSTAQVVEEVKNRIESRVYDFIVMNLASADMVGHTGNIEAAVNGVKAIDSGLAILSNTVLAKGGALVITSDHGNAEQMINEETGGVDTEHNKNTAPLIIVSPQLKGKNAQLPIGLLADVAPTILPLANIPRPSQMTGRNLLG